MIVGMYLTPFRPPASEIARCRRCVSAPLQIGC